MSPSPAGAGFTLLEAVVALGILSLALMLGLAVLAQQPRIHRHAQAHREAHQALSATLEGLRAGTVPAVSGTVSRSLFAATDPGRSGPTGPLLGRPATGGPGLGGSPLGGPVGAGAEGLVVRLTVSPDPEIADLSRVEATAVYRVADRVFQRRVETMIWVRP